MIPVMPASTRSRSPGSVKKVALVGAALGALLTAGLALLLLQDRQARVASAQRQAVALSVAVDRLLRQEFGSLERALGGIAADILATPPSGQTDVQLRRAIDGVVARRAELGSIVLVDAQGRPVAGGVGDPTLPSWSARVPSGRLAVGPLRSNGRGGWWLNVAAPAPGGQWLLAQLDTVTIDRMIAGLDIGRDGQATVLDRNGIVLARAPEGRRFVGTVTRLPAELRDARGSTSGQRVSQIDGVERLVGFSANSGYDIVVVAGLALHETLVPWYRNASIALGFVVLYWLGLGYFLRRLHDGERVREALLSELEEQANWLDQAQSASRTGVWRMEPGGEQIKVSAQTAAIYGFEPKAGVLPLVHFFERMHPQDRGHVEDAFNLTLATGAPYDAEFRVLPRPGQERWVRESGGLVPDARGQGRVTGTVVDVTDAHRAQDRIERTEAQFRALFERNPLPFWVFDEQTLRFLAVNQAAVAAYGYSQEEFRSMTILDIRPAKDRDAVRETISQRDHHQEVDGVWTHLRRDRSTIDVRVFSSGIEFAGRPARLVLAEDVSDRVAYERDLAWRAAHDSLTGLTRLQTLVEQLQAQQNSGGASYAVAFVQLLGLELIAPTLGAQTSELLLREMAARIDVVGRRFGMCGFWPGDSFVVVARDPARHDEMLAELQEAIATPVDIGGGAQPVEAAIGVALGPGPDEGAEQVIGHAALAALQARQEQVPLVYYDRTMAEQATERIALVRRLRSALANGEFELHYQPIWRLSDGRLVALEALLRWSRDGQPVSPAVFVPLAEASGLIVPIGRWVLEQAARCHGRLAARGLDDVAIAVNISAVQLLGDNVAAEIRALQHGHRLAPGALHVELTESVLLRQPQLARARMLELRDSGVSISIDDFGTGFSSMAYLRDLPLDYMKIDRSFVRGVHADERNASICRALIALARGLGLGTIAEGVEEEGERAWLRENGCDQVQGYLLGRPAPLDTVLDRLGAQAS